MMLNLFRSILRSGSKELQKPRRPLRPARRLEIEELEPRVDACSLDWDIIFGGPNPMDQFGSFGRPLHVETPGLDPACIASITWAVPPFPVIFADYIHTPNLGKVIPYTPPNPADKDPLIGFFWGPMETITTVTVDVTSTDGVTKSSSGRFVIHEPQFNGADLFVDFVFPSDPGPVIGLGKPGADIPGFKYTANVTAPKPGNFFFIQLQ